MRRWNKSGIRYKRILLFLWKGLIRKSVTAPTYFADALTRLFENIAVIIDQHQPLVEMHYGKGKMLRVIQRLQEEGDKQGIAILDRFLQTRKLESKVKYSSCVRWCWSCYSLSKYNVWWLPCCETATPRSDHHPIPLCRIKMMPATAVAIHWLIHASWMPIYMNFP